MATTYTANFQFIEPAVKDPTTTDSWAPLLNLDFVLIDSAIAGFLQMSVAGGSTVVLTTIQGQPDQSRNYSFVFTGLLTANIVVLWPQGANRNMRVTNSTTGNFTLSCGADNGSGVAAGGTYTVPQGATSLLASDGTNVTASFNDGFLPLSGGTLTGNPNVTLRLNSPTVGNRNYITATGGLTRWNMFTNSTAEAGADAGSNWLLQYSHDDGSLAGTALSFVRSTGIGTFGQIPLFPTASAGSGNTKGANTQYVDNAIITYANFAGITYFPISGGTITGNVTVGNGATSALLGIDGIAGTARSLQYKSSSVLRWQVATNTGAESGANAGSNFILQSFSDAGALLSTPLSFVRSTGVGTFAQTPAFPTASAGTATTAGANTAFVQNAIATSNLCAQGVSTPSGTGSFVILASISLTAPAGGQSYLLLGNINQAFGGVSNWGLELFIGGVFAGGITGTSTPDAAPTVSTPANMSGPQTITLRWFGQNANVSILSSTLLIMPVQL